MANEFDFKLNSGNVMPAIGLGTYAELRGEDKVRDAVIAAVKAGYRHIDCAAFYENEKAIGQGLKQLFDENIVTRQDIFITSKIWSTCHRPDLVRPALLKTLQDLQLSYIDLYLIHWPMAFKEGGESFPLGPDKKLLYSDVDYVDTWKELEKCVDEGLVKDIGISNFNKSQIDRILQIARIKPSNNQVECHIHLAQTKLIDYCKSKNITVTAYSPLGAPSYTSTAHVWPLEEPLIKQLASDKNRTPAQIIIRFLLQRKVAVVPKSVTPSRIVSNFRVFDFELSEEEMSKILDLNINDRHNKYGGASTHKNYPFKDEY